MVMRCVWGGMGGGVFYLAVLDAPLPPPSRSPACLAQHRRTKGEGDVNVVVMLLLLWW